MREIRRPSDVPETNFWRSMDIYSDHMVRRYEQGGMPLERIDTTGMMIGTTGTIYYRKTNAWQGMLLLMARGGWVNTIHGNLEFLDEEKARWFAKVQRLYEGCRPKAAQRLSAASPAMLSPTDLVHSMRRLRIRGCESCPSHSRNHDCRNVTRANAARGRGKSSSAMQVSLRTARESHHFGPRANGRDGFRSLRMPHLIWGCNRT